MQYLQGDSGQPGKLLEAYRTIHQALEVSSDYETMYDAARYSARSKHEDGAVEFLDKCIDIHPHTVISMFAEADFQGMLPKLHELLFRKLQEVRKRLEIEIRRIQVVLQRAAEAEKRLNLRFKSVPPSTDKFKPILQWHQQADYLTSVQFEKRIAQIRERLITQCTKDIQSSLNARRNEVRTTEAALSDLKQRQQFLLTGAHNAGGALLDKAYADSKDGVISAHRELELAESKLRQEEDSEIKPGWGHFGLGCVAHFVVFIFIIGVIYGSKPPSEIDWPLALWMFTGWIAFGYLFTLLSVQLRIQLAKAARSKRCVALEQAKQEQQQLVTNARLKGEEFLEKAKTKSQELLDEHAASLGDKLQQNRNRVSEAEFELGTFSQLT